VTRLVALDVAPGPDFVSALRTVWDRGDAVLALDARLDPDRRRAVAVAARAAAILGPSGAEVELPDAVPLESGDALVVATSGSTGEPRFAVHTHASVSAASAAVADRLELDGDEHWLGCLPVSHVGGLSVVTRAMHIGAALTLLPGFDRDAVAEAARHGARHISLVATALRRVEASWFDRILLGGASAPENLPANVVVTYGMTETFGGVVYDGVPLDGVEVRVVDDEIQLRGPTTMRAWRDGRPAVDAAGWLRTADLGRLDASGRLVVEGRRDDVVVTGGEKVWPEPVESCIRSLDGVVDVAVAGLPDDEWGQRVVAWIVAAPGVVPTLEDVRAAVREALPPWQAPREVRLVERIPRTDLGKVRRSVLRGGLSSS